MITSSRTTSNSSTVPLLDGLSNYEIHEEIGRGATAIVYRATCKRGRLRNRQVALKKILAVPTENHSELAHISASSGLHQVLHHPSIVSLLSTFTASGGHYHVLELCSHGTLSALLHSRHPPVLTEAEVRGVVKSLVDALIYLRNERICHRDIKASNVLLTEDFRIKLSDFGLATRLPTPESTTQTFCGSPNYVAPEIVARVPYGFSVDVWSLGCLMLTCLSGIPAFEAPSVPDVFKKVSRGEYFVPDNISFEAKDLIAGLLQSDPSHRIPLHRILSHPFFKPSLPVQSLSVLSKSTRRLPFIDLRKENTMAGNELGGYHYPRPLSCTSSNPIQAFSGPVQPLAAKAAIPTRNPLTNVVNLDLRAVLSDNVPESCANKLAGLVKRVPSMTFTNRHTASSEACFGHRFSRAQSAASTPALTADSGSPSTCGETIISEEYQQIHINKLAHPLKHPLLQRATVHSGSNRVLHGPGKAPVYSRPRATSIATIKFTHTQDSEYTQHPHYNQRTPEKVHSVRSHHQDVPTTTWLPKPAILTKSNHPQPFSTAYLAAETHKVAHGQLVVLPSKMLLVDFREGERRKGRKGNEVMLISPGGSNEIQIFSAPHLSTPCCLAEPLASYTLAELPKAYWKMYSDAGRLVNQLKQRIPKLVHYKPDVKCSLMANDPQGDIELLFSPTDAQNPPQAKYTDSATEAKAPRTKATQMRIRLSRQRQSLEIARFVSGSAPPASTEKQARMGEWMKKVLFVPQGRIHSGLINTLDLDSNERTGLDHVLGFLRVCEALEALECVSVSTDAPPPSPPPSHITVHELQRDTQELDRQLQDPCDGRYRLGKVLSRMEARARAVISQDATSEDDNASKAGAEDGTYVTVATTASTKVLPSLSLAPRPAKFSPALQRQSSRGSGINLRSGTALGLDPVARSASISQVGASRSRRSSLCEEEPQAHFIPSIGWCTRSGFEDRWRYRIMFNDGATLEVLPDSPDDKAIRYTIGPGESPLCLSRASAFSRLPVQMKALESFVESFSSSRL